MLHVPDRHRHGLLEQTSFLELVRVDEGADETSVGILLRTFAILSLCRQGWSLGGFWSECLVAIRNGGAGARGWGGIRFPGSTGSRTALGGPLLLAGREWTVQLAVDEEVGQYSAG